MSQAKRCRETNHVAQGPRYKLSYDAEQYNTIHTLLKILYLQPLHLTVRHDIAAMRPGKLVFRCPCPLRRLAIHATRSIAGVKS